MSGFPFVGRQRELEAFQAFAKRPGGELLVITGPEGAGKSHLLRRLRVMADGLQQHFVLFANLGALPSAEMRLHAVLTALVKIHRSGRESESSAGVPAGTRLMMKPREFLDHLLAEEQWPPQEKLLHAFSTTAEGLAEEALLIVLMDLGRADEEDAFPLHFFAHHLLDRIKLVVAKRTAEPHLAEHEGVTVLPELPPLTESEAAAVFAFHLGKTPENASLGARACQAYGGSPLAVDLAAKVLGTSHDPAKEFPSLPREQRALCRMLLQRMDAPQQRVVQCVARVPTGVDFALLREVSGLDDETLRTVLRTEGMHNVLLSERSPDGRRARLFHERFADAVLGAGGESGPAAREFHKRAAAYFLSRLAQDRTDIEALCAHTAHLRQSADKRQFVEDFSKTFEIKNEFHLFRDLAEEYPRLLQYCDELGVKSVDRATVLTELGRVLKTLGDQEGDTGRYREAVGRFREALELAGEQASAEDTASLHAHLAAAHKALGQFPEALEHLQRAAELDQQLGDEESLAADWNDLGIIYQELGQPDQALQYHQKALRLHENHGNEVGCANALANLGDVYRHLGDLDEALRCHQRAWRIDSHASGPAVQANGLVNIGLVHADRDDFEKAISCCEEAIHLDQGAGDLEGKTEHLRALASVHQRAENHRAAVDVLRQAFEIDRAVDNVDGIAEDLQALVLACRAAGDLEGARDALHLTIQLHQRTGDPEGAARTRRALETLDQPPAAQPDGQEADIEIEDPAPEDDPVPEEDDPVQEAGEAPPAERSEKEADLQRRVAELEAQLAKYEPSDEESAQDGGEDAPPG